MGREVEREAFTDADYARFGERLRQSLRVLESLLQRPGFGEGAPSIGAELELFLVDAAGRPLPRNRLILREAAHPRLTLETDRFNLECNTTPVALAGRPFTALGEELRDVLAAVDATAARHGGRGVTVGILPTLAPADLTSEALTQSARYRVLSASLRRLRDAPFVVRIEGHETLAITAEDVTFEGATSSWQLHLKVPPACFARTYNAAQIATAPVLAVAGNAPFFLGRRLWDETRIALFRQSVDERVAAGGADDWRPARVTFGHGWVRTGALELFAESVALHPPIIPVVDDEDPADAAVRGVPSLAELRLHQSTVWRWNRAVYDPADGGHVRIEMRALPAGPTLTDMLANAAFLLGLTLALAREGDELVTRLTFGQARASFYAAARHGLDAELLWPSAEPPSPRVVPAAALVARLLPRAREALVEGGVEPTEADGLLAVIEGRLARRTTGARWQVATVEALESHRGREAALAGMLERYAALSKDGEPVHLWHRSHFS